jgi:hypothetical protein
MWLDRQLRAAFAAVADEPLPHGLLSLISDAEAQNDALVRVDQRIAQADQLIGRQQLMVIRLQARDRDARLAEILLEHMTEAARHMQCYRDMIVRYGGHRAALIKR